MRYRLKFESGARRQFKRLLPQLKREVLEELEALLDDPYPVYTKPLIREWHGAYRIYIDGWRLIYTVDEIEKVIVVMRIAQRDANTYL
ncbi:MAG: type II toxin-antitoxin system mRNA interferase toxin, RelE/StbE family [Caldilineaceae bacterium]